MVAFSKVALALGVVGSVSAAVHTSRHTSTHHVRALPDGSEVTSYSPPSTFETFGEGVDHPLSKRQVKATTEEAAVEFVASRTGFSRDSIQFKKQFNNNGSERVFLRQKINGLEVANAVANVALNRNGRVVSFGANFVRPRRVASTTPRISLADAISSAEAKLGATYNGQAPTVEFYAKDNGDVALTHVIQLESEDHWYEAYVDAQSGELVAANDFVNQASYLVVPITEQDPRAGLQLIANPEDSFSSPQGWLTGTATTGNNVVAFKGSATSTTSQSSSGVFNYPPNLSAQPTTTPNVNSARTNAFYIANALHDITYRYGFTEAAFNFQNDNFGKGGAGNDRVTISVQDSGGTNNANFATPPDGQSGRMRMYLWTSTTPQRDGALSNDIVVHEYTHGITNRLTGGGTGRCLQTTESGALGEGWSDALADWTEQVPSIKDFTLGSWVRNNTAGIRTMPYSTNIQVNSLTYADIPRRSGVHAIGEVWAATLHDIHGALVQARGFSTSAATNPSGTQGNIVWLHLFIDALSIQPCNPTFLQARDAWIQADVDRYNGANRCTLWNSFARRGLGVNARNNVNNNDVPSGC